MKKLIILSAIAMSGLVYNTANAQIGVRVGFRFGPLHVRYANAPAVVEQAPVYEQKQPVYDEPAQVYDDSNDDYYYLPDVDAYYSVNEQCYYYNDGENWVSAAYLPGVYRNYDWRSGRRYEVRAPRPYMHNDFYRSRYNGRQGDWAHNNFGDRFNRGNQYADHFNRDGYKGQDQHFDNRGQSGFNHPNRGGEMNNQHFDNRGRGGFSQPAQPNRDQQMNNPHFDNRGQGGNSRQPSNQNNGRSNENRGGAEHFSQNNHQGGFGGNRMSKF